MSVEQLFLKGNERMQWHRPDDSKYFHNQTDEKLMLCTRLCSENEVFIDYGGLLEAKQNGVKYCAYMSQEPYVCRILYVDRVLKAVDHQDDKNGVWPTASFAGCIHTLHVDYSCFFKAKKPIYESDPDEYDDLSEMQDLGF